MLELISLGVSEHYALEDGAHLLKLVVLRPCLTGVLEAQPQGWELAPGVVAIGKVSELAGPVPLVIRFDEAVDEAKLAGHVIQPFAILSQAFGLNTCDLAEVLRALKKGI